MNHFALGSNNYLLGGVIVEKGFHRNHFEPVWDTTKRERPSSDVFKFDLDPRNRCFYLTKVESNHSEDDCLVTKIGDEIYVLSGASYYGEATFEVRNPVTGDWLELPPPPISCCAILGRFVLDRKFIIYTVEGESYHFDLEKQKWQSQSDNYVADNFFELTAEPYPTVWPPLNPIEFLVPGFNNLCILLDCQSDVSRDRSGYSAKTVAFLVNKKKGNPLAFKILHEVLPVDPIETLDKALPAIQPIYHNISQSFLFDVGNNTLCAVVAGRRVDIKLEVVVCISFFTLRLSHDLLNLGAGLLGLRHDHDVDVDVDDGGSSVPQDIPFLSVRVLRQHVCKFTAPLSPPSGSNFLGCYEAFLC